MITLKTLLQASAQEVFDQSVLHVVKQGRPSMNGGMCCYRSNKGLKCAAGCFIADDEYNGEWEGYTWTDRQVSAPDTHQGLIRALQSAHDKAARDDVDFLPEFLENARMVAEHFKLKMPELPSFSYNTCTEC